MSIADRILSGIRDVLRQQDKIETLSHAVKELANEVRELDRRMIRIETLVELAERQTHRDQLPSGDKDS